MAFFDWLFQSDSVKGWDSPQDQLTKLTIDDLYGLDVTGIADLTRAGAMAIPSVAKIRNRIASKIGGFPLVAMKGNGLYKDTPKWCENLESDRAQYNTLVWIADALIFYGRAYLQIVERDAAGWPKQFRFVPEWKAETERGQLLKAFGQKVKSADWVRIDAHHEGLLNYGQEALKRAALIEVAASRAAENPVPSIELHQTGGADMTDKQIDSLIKRWADARRNKNGGVAFTSTSIETKTHGQAAEQLLINGRNLAAIDVARAMGAPAWMIDATTSGSSITYGNVNSRSRELVEDLLEPYMNAIAGRLSLDDVLARGVWLKLDAGRILRDDFKTRMEGYKLAIEAEIYTAEECKMIEAGTPLEKAEG